MPRARIGIFKSHQGSAREERSTEAGFDCTSRATCSEYQLQNSFARRSSKVQAETFGAAQARRSLKKYRRDLLDYRVPHNITKRRRDSHIFPTDDGIDHDEILHQSLPLVNNRVKPRYSHWRNTTTDSAFISTRRNPDHEGSHGSETGPLMSWRTLPTEVTAEHLTSYPQKERIPDQRRTSQTILLHKKGDREDLRNYRRICC
ncbi:unnamed protein product [Strongylus vulgaris]|uniref:Uncharacterized protein n=1 Tax=Strongylus vulgaris TaxID=40348 RepID=A0A3P7IJZ2_STRVU|nr:unnamed protein product [Strongylus vulgaris]